MKERLIPYGPKWTTALFGLLLSGSLLSDGVWHSLRPERLPGSLLAIVGPAGAMAVMLIGAVATATMGVLCAYLLIVSITGRRVIALHDEFMLFPHGVLRSSSARIRYETIRSVQIEPLGTRRALRVRTHDATLLIVESMLPSSAQFELLVRTLSPRSTNGNAATS